MIRTLPLAALTLALMSATGFAQSAPPAQLSGPNAQAPYGQGPNAQGPYAQGQYSQGPSDQDQRSRDIFCRRDAAARTGYVTPGQAAAHEQTNGTVLGT